MTDTLRRDLKQAFRYAVRRPLSSGAIVLTLGAVIAAAAAAFGLARAVLWKPLPFPGEDRLVFVWEEVTRDGERSASRVTGARHAAWRDAAGPAFESMSLFGAAGFTLESPAGAESIRGVRTSASFFDTLGVHALRGRTFGPADETPGQDRVIVVSHAFWQQRLGGRDDAVGRTVRLGGHSYTVIGVVPPAVYPGWPVNPAAVAIDKDQQEFFVPIPRTAALDASPRAHVFGVVARLRPGVSAAQARDLLAGTADPAQPDPHGTHVTALREQFVRDARAPLLALAGAALAIVLIACANLAALHLSAFESRRSEFAVRAAIGAGPYRLVRQVVIESFLLAVAGGAIGLLLAGPALQAVPALAPATLPLLNVPALDLRVVLFAVGLALVATAIMTLWPIRRLLATAPAPRGIPEGTRGPVQRVLVVSQIALSVALVTVAALLSQSLVTVRGRDPGFVLDQVFVAEVSLPSTGTPDPRRLAAVEATLLDAVVSVPGVLSAAAAYDHPLEANWSETPTVAGDTERPEDRRQAELRIVSPGYFEALGVDVLEGRAFAPTDDLDAPGAAVVSEAFDRAIGGRAIGRRLQTGTPQFMYPGAPRDFVIVGVVRNERVRGLEAEAGPAFYLSTRQFPQGGFTILVRTAGDPDAIAGSVRTAIRGIDPRITVDQPTTLERILGEQLAARRLTTGVINGLASAALALAAVGMYGLLSILVSSRTREIGVRLALGAPPRHVASRVIRESLANGVIGLAIGCGLALMAGRLVRGLLVGVSPTDPLTLLLVGGTLLAVSIVASLGPALRAASTDPVRALRAE